MAGLRNEVALQSVLVAAKLDPTGVKFLRCWTPGDVGGADLDPTQLPHWVAVVGRNGSMTTIRLGKTAEDALGTVVARLEGLLPPLKGTWNAGQAPKPSEYEVRAQQERAKALQRAADRQAAEAKARRREQDKAERAALARNAEAERREREAVRKVAPAPRRRKQIQEGEVT